MLPVLHFVLLRAFCVKMELKYRGQTHGGEEKGQDLNMWHAGEERFNKGTRVSRRIYPGREFCRTDVGKLESE